ncbi:MAG: hypothetical protein U0804_27425 [Gemmataceae bacterium]
MADMKNNVKSGIDDAARAAKSGVNEAASAAKNATEQAGGVTGTIRDTAQHLADRAGDLASQAKDRVTDLAGQARDRLGDWAGNVNAESVQRFAHDAYDAVGERAGDFGREVTSLVRRYPLPAILVGFGVGLLIGRAARSA